MAHEPSDYPGDQQFAEQALGAVCYDSRYYGDIGDPLWASAEGAATWMRHCLGHAPDTVTIAVLMPGSAATNRQARPLRSVLLRSGVLRAIVSGLPGGRDHWLLGASNGARPGYVLLVDANDDPARAAVAWHAFQRDPMHPEAAPHAVRVVDRLDEHIDLTPAATAAYRIDQYPALRTMLADRPVGTPPPLQPNEDAHRTVSLGELAEAGAVGFHQSPPTVLAGAGATAMLTAKDVRLGRSPSRRGAAEVPGAVIIRAGDVAVVPEDAVVRECVDDGVLLGPGIELVRADPDLIDSRFLVGVLRAALTRAGKGSVDLYEVGFPRLPLTEQARYAIAFAELRALEQEWRQRREALEHLVLAGFEGLATGRLRPVDPGA
ncbi:hypothetical protein ACL02S_08715 [Nocardia sp. 004]|uniref:hypothetical protein n=1 Tax=Nocardia sp. 004 TaxID=3385978 RepID=UPI0039A3928D